VVDSELKVRVGADQVRSASLLEVDELAPGIGLESEEFVGAPVDGVDLVGFAIRNGGHGEGEAVDGHLLMRLLAHTAHHVQRQALIEVFAAEATHDNYSITIELGSA